MKRFKRFVITLFIGICIGICIGVAMALAFDYYYI